MKVYVFYYKKNTYPYAHTTDKSFRDTFMNQRNMNKFRYKKVKMDDEEYREFLDDYRNQTLDNFVYGSFNESSYCNIAATYKEDSMVTQKCDELDSEIQDLCDELLKDPSIKCKDSISFLKDIFEFRYIGNEKWPVSKINGLSVFVSLFKDTLM